MVEAGDERVESQWSSVDDIDDESDKDDSTSPARYDIISHGVDFDVAGIVRRLNQEDILIPDWQRSYVWNIRMASSFVESLLLGLPVPGVFLGADPSSGQRYVIDGQQRLKTLQHFYAGKFPTSSGHRTFELTGVQDQFEGMVYDYLSDPYRRALDDSLIHATVVRQLSPTDDDTSMYQIFKRLNTGGRVVNPQEIRSAIYQGRLIQNVRQLNGFDKWRDMVGKPSARLKDEEMILRFMAMWRNGDGYTASMSEFLNKFTQANRNPDDLWLSEMASLFERTVAAFAGAKGRDAFRFDRARGQGRRRAISAALFDSMAVGLARRIEKSGVPSECFIGRIHDDLINSDDYLQHVVQSTSTETSVKQRMRIATDAFADA